MTIENGCRMRRELTVRTSVPSKLECCTWSSKASHQYSLSVSKSTERPLGHPRVTFRKTMRLLPSVCARLILAGRSHSEKNMYLKNQTRRGHFNNESHKITFHVQVVLKMHLSIGVTKKGAKVHVCNTGTITLTKYQ